MNVPSAMFNTFGIKLPNDEFVFYQVINGKVVQILNYMTVGDELLFVGKEPSPKESDVEYYQTYAQIFESDNGTRHRLGFFGPEVTGKVLNAMVA